jgi:polyphosphate glucokinase
MAREVDKTAEGPITLAIDIGGTGLKIQALSPEGRPMSDRLRVPTPEPATTRAVLVALDELKVSVPLFDRVSVGFPGVIKRGRWRSVGVSRYAWPTIARWAVTQ